METAVAKIYVYVASEAGLIIREIFDMKTLLRIRAPYNQLGTERTYSNVEITQSFYLSEKNALFLSAQELAARDTRTTTYAISYTRYF